MDLIGKIVYWPTYPRNDDDTMWLTQRFAGRGRITEVIQLAATLLFVVETIPRPEHDEPPYSLILPADAPGLRLFPSLDAEEAWIGWAVDGDSDLDTFLKNQRGRK